VRVNELGSTNWDASTDQGPAAAESIFLRVCSCPAGVIRNWVQTTAPVLVIWYSTYSLPEGTAAGR